MQIGLIGQLILALTLPFMANMAHSETPNESRWGFEVQIYPTGIIPGVRYEWDVSSQDQLFARIAYNFTERSDFCEHDD